MQYLSPELSKKLAAKGLVSDSQCHYLKQKDGDFYLFHSEELGDDLDWIPSYPAYQLSDILLNKDNAIKLWGEEEIDCDCSHECDCKCIVCKEGWNLFEKREAFKWQIKTFNFLNLHLSGGDVEAELLKQIT